MDEQQAADNIQGAEKQELHELADKIQSERANLLKVLNQSSSSLSQHTMTILGLVMRWEAKNDVNSLDEASARAAISEEFDRTKQLLNTIVAAMVEIANSRSNFNQFLDSIKNPPATEAVKK